MYVSSYHTHRPHTDTPHEYLQFAFACTDLMIAHVSTLRCLSLKNFGIINDDYINLIQNKPLKHLFLKLQPDIQKLIDRSVLEMLNIMQNK